MTNQTSNTTSSPRSAKRRVIFTTLAVLLVGGAVLLAAGLSRDTADADGQTIWAEAKTQRLVISVDQTGQVEASTNEVIRSQVREPTDILWLIPEGETVTEGDLLVELDPQKFIDRIEDLSQRLDDAKASVVAAEVTLENTLSQGQSNIEKAELDLEFARLAIAEYMEGEYPQQLKKAESDVEIARETLQRARSRAEWSRKLAEEGYITATEAEADAAAAKKAQLDLEVAEGELALLKKYQHYEQRRRLESDLSQAEAELQRVKNRAKADGERTRVDLSSKQRGLTRLERQLEEAHENLENCKIHAPAAGRVVYAPQGNRWRRNEPLAEGSTVRPNQEIIRIPVAGAMSAAIKIDESQRDKVEQGMLVRLTFPSLPDQVYLGRLVRIAEYLDPSGFWNSFEKVYSATVDIQGDTQALRTGMNCMTQIIVAEYDEALVVPLQSVIRMGNKHQVYMQQGDAVTPRTIEIGMDNGRVVRVLSGLNAGEQVMLTPPLEPAEKPAMQLETSDPPDTPQPTEGTDTSDAAQSRDTPTSPNKSPNTSPSQDADPQATVQQRPGGGMDGKAMTQMVTRFVKSDRFEDVEMSDADRQRMRDLAQRIESGDLEELGESDQRWLRNLMRKAMGNRGSGGGGGSQRNQP